MCWCFWFSPLLSVSIWFSLLIIHPAVPIPTAPAPLFRSLPGLMGLRPCGLEDDVRQYEQDLAKRLYQARVRASQGTSEAPTSSASSAASQLRSASRPRQLGPDAMHHGGVLGCFGIEYFFAKSSERSKQALAAVLWQCFHHLCCLASARLCRFQLFLLLPFSPLCLVSPSLQSFLAPWFHTLLCINTLRKSFVSWG